VTFQGVEVVVLCYKVTYRNSLENAIHKVRYSKYYHRTSLTILYRWFPMIRHYQRSVRVLLIGCMSDTEGLDPCHMPVSEGEVKKAGHEIGAVQWLECTTLDRRSGEAVAQALGWYGYHYASLATHAKKEPMKGYLKPGKLSTFP
jgi:hypothetical protein